MYSNISLSKGTPIGKIIGGKYDGLTIHINKQDKKDPECQEFFMGMDDKGIIEPIYHTQLNNEANRFLISGSGGSGKSYFAKHLADNFLEQYPKKKTVLISGTPRVDNKIFYCEKCIKILEKIEEMDEPSEFLEDKIRRCKECGYIKKLKIDSEILDDPIDINIFKHSLVIFDDIDRLDDDIADELHRMEKKIINTGRISDISIMVINQSILGGKKTSVANKNSFCATVFPNSGSKYEILYYLSKYLFFPIKLTNRLLDLPTRWLHMNICVPRYVLHQKGCLII